MTATASIEIRDHGIYTIEVGDDYELRVVAHEPPREPEPSESPTPPPPDPVPSRGRVARAFSYARAEESLLVRGPASDVVQAFRAACCTGEAEGGIRVADPCPRFRDGFCTACGCPEWSRSKMSVKWTMPASACPLGRFAEV